ncbi:E3 ubiquitin/ISG15 ligase TRIM25-like [Mytilus californianus]|uniref:E3 ubiquitin/ISG15 ligase TRIM25-like n=1 Tax=Mytilus californianus TaxID=6549 RepID=UPI0022476969|nr:E3 ubiquitin/ISG15 ligase TRIM25-like [Mytilus californianus]
MDTPTKVLCGICDAQHITKIADFWCPECDDGLCDKCKSHHSFSKASRHHDVISIEDYRKLPTEISSIMHHCTEHEKNLQMYCPRHDQLCCLLCISTSHKDCTGMLPIEDIAKTSQSSGLFESLQNSLEGMKNNIDRIVQDRQTNLTNIKAQRQKIYDGLKQLRKRINCHLDKLEKETIKQLCTAECDMNIKIEDLLKELQEKSDRIAVLQNNISYLKNHASDLQSFIGSKKLQEKIESEETYIQSLTEDGRLKQLSLKCAQNEFIEDLLLNITSFGLISMETSPPTVVIKLEKIKQAQIMSASVIPEPVDDMNATFSGMINNSTDNIGPRVDVKRTKKVDPRPCSVCFTTGFCQCSRCKTPYCSEECQRSDWDKHKHLCQDLSK